MADQTPEYLSAEELRNRLYHSLRNRGLVNSIKSQLRNSLVTELQQSVRGPLTLKDLNVPEGGSLLHRASNSLVANHLRACKYEYTLSVFLPECGLNQDKKFDTADLLKLLNISPHSRLYQRLSDQSHQDSKQGFLWQLLTEVCSLHANSIQNVGCQTDLIKVGPITPLDVKLSNVDELYSSRRDDFLQSGRSGAEERMLNFQRQLEDRYNTQLKMELARIRDAEIAAMKLEEKENSRKALEQARRDLERLYKDKHDALVLRERNATERLQQQLELQERETYAQRQSILEEIEAVRQREAEVRREAEVNKREKKLSEDRVRDKETDLRRRELEIRQKETSFEQRLQNEMAQFKLDQQARFIERLQNIEAREAAVKEGERAVAEEKGRIQQVKDELRDKTHRVNELETLLSEAKYSEMNATKNNEYLNAKLRDMSDYNTLKEQVVLYRNELETVRTRLAEVLAMNERERGRQEELLRELRRPSPESLMLHRDLEKAKENLRQEQIVFNQQKQLLETRLKEELDRNRDLLQRFEEQSQQMRETNREIVDLRQHLHMTTRALNNEVYKKPAQEHDGLSLHESRRPQKETSFSKHSVDLNLDFPGPRRSLRFEADAKDVYHDVDFDLPPISRSGRGDYCDDEASSVDSADVIAHAKYRLMNLDKEAHNLEKAYHDFHCRITNINALPLTGSSSLPQDAAKSDEQGQPGMLSPRQSPRMISPRQSPILFENPMSSTPYKQSRRVPDFDDSFSELGTKVQRQTRGGDLPLPQLDLLSMADHSRSDKRHLEEEERRVQMRPITVDDLEQRPGSPGIIVVTGSMSSDEACAAGRKPPAAKENKTDALVHKSAPYTAVEQTQAWPGLGNVGAASTQMLPSSLDSAWKTQQEEEDEPDKHINKQQRETEVELNQQKPRLLPAEDEAPEGEHEQVTTALVAVKNDEDEDQIDPVMKAYMARVLEQKEKEKEMSRRTVDPWGQGQPGDGTPHLSESEDLSVAVDDKSDQADDSW